MVYRLAARFFSVVLQLSPSYGYACFQLLAIESFVCG